MFQAEYSSGQPLRMLVDLRAAIDDALGRSAAGPPPPAKSVAAAAKLGPAKPAMAAKAGAAASAAKFNVAADEAPEFEISVGGDEWNPDAPGNNRK
jgi:hypothetical protein